MFLSRVLVNSAFICLKVFNLLLISQYTVVFTDKTCQNPQKHIYQFIPNRSWAAMKIKSTVDFSKIRHIVVDFWGYDWSDCG